MNRLPRLVAALFLSIAASLQPGTAADKADAGFFDFGGASAEALALYRQGWVEILRFGRWTEAERLYREAVAADPDFLIALSVLARITADREERDRLYATVENRINEVDEQGRLLLHTYQRTLELFAMREAGESFSAEDRRAMARRAVADYGRFLETSPREWSVIIEYMEWVHALDGPEAALSVVEKLREGSETPLYFSYFPSWFEAELGNHERAAAMADDFALRLNDPQAPQPYFLEAYLAQQRGELHVARERIEKALELDPRHLLAARLQAELVNTTAAADLPLFSESETLVATLEFPMRDLRKNAEQSEPLEGSFSYVENGRERVFRVSVMPRGNSRREMCAMPPLKLDFHRDELAGSLLEGQNKLKLVTHCEASASFYRYIEHEYVIYQLYRQLTDAAFRVRRLELSYRDARKPGRVKTYPAFLIESDREVAARLGMEESERESLTDADLEPEAITRLGLFQFMIGNTDWSLRRGRSGEPCCHNGLLLRDSSGQHVIVPYDFDQAGLIDADYALPAKMLGISSVRQRVFRGLCTGEARIEAVLTEMEALRPAFQAEFPADGSMKRANRRARSYIDSFFELVNDPETLAEAVLAECRGNPDTWASASR